MHEIHLTGLRMKTMEAKWNLSTAKIISPVRSGSPRSPGGIEAGGNLVLLVISVCPTISNNCSMNWVQEFLWERLLVNYGVTTVPSSSPSQEGHMGKKQEEDHLLFNSPWTIYGLLRNNFLEKFVLRVKYIISHNFHSSVFASTIPHWIYLLMLLHDISSNAMSVPWLTLGFNKPVTKCVFGSPGFYFKRDY